MSTGFLEAILEGGIQNPNFFNGRVLTSQDLRDTQAAERQRATRLGQVLGEGVAYGLFVSASGATLAITPGLAVNRRGEALLLPKSASLALAITGQETSGLDSPFAPCVPADLTTGSISTGFYLLAITPATGLSKQRAATSSLNGSTAACTARYEVEGVQFKLLTLLFSDTGTAQTRWSRLVHACFGTETLLLAAPNSFSAPPRYGLVDTLRAQNKLLDCDVPLAVLHWADNGVQILDVWAVRRPPAGASGLAEWPIPTAPGPTAELWSQHAASRRMIEGMAFFLQFQAQLERLRTTLSHPEDEKAETYFTFLPAAGFLPLPASGRQGFNWPAFFGLPTQPEPLTQDPAFLRDVLQRSFFVDPIPVTAGKSLGVELYTVEAASTALPYVLFLRSQKQVVAVPPQPEPSPEPKPADGTLVVRVTDPGGKTLTADDVAEVTATDLKGKVYRGQLYRGGSKLDWGKGRFIAQWLAEEPRKETIGVTEMKVRPKSVSVAGQDLALYIFDPLPAGKYTVRATPGYKGLYGANSTTVTLASGGLETLDLELRAPIMIPPREKGTIVGRPKDKWPLPNGTLVDKIYVDKRWRDPRPPRPDEELLDPAKKKDWAVDPPRDLVDQVEDGLGVWLEDTPGLSVTGPELYVRPDFKSGTIYDEPYAFVRTGDGSYYPAVLVTGEQTLLGDVPGTRAGLPDLDPVTYEASLRGTGLASLDALAAAPTSLIGDSLNLDRAGAASLVGDARNAITGFQSAGRRFATYPGVDAATGSKLAETFADDVALANAKPDQVMAALGGAEAGYTEGFAQRLISRARSVVPKSSWSLEGLNLGSAGESALGGLGVDSLGALSRLAAGDGAGGLKAALNLDDDGLHSLTTTAQASMVAGQARIGRDAGVSSLEGITADRASTLVTAGLGTVSKLANADRSEVAAKLGISTSEAAALVDRAIAASGVASVDKVPGITADQAAALKDKGIVSVGDLARADKAALGIILGSDALANRVGAGAGLIVGRGGLFR